MSTWATTNVDSVYQDTIRCTAIFAHNNRCTLADGHSDSHFLFVPQTTYNPITIGNVSAPGPHAQAVNQAALKPNTSAVWLPIYPQPIYQPMTPMCREVHAFNGLNCERPYGHPDEHFYLKPVRQPMPAAGQTLTVGAGAGGLAPTWVSGSGGNGAVNFGGGNGGSVVINGSGGSGVAGYSVGYVVVGSGISADPWANMAESLASSRATVASWKKEGLCPKCGSKGTWIAMAAVCKEHGRFLGA